MPGGGQINANTFALNLRATGEIEIAYGAMESREAVAGVSPGGTLELTAADFVRGTPAGSAGALVERMAPLVGIAPIEEEDGAPDAASSLFVAVKAGD